MKKIVRRIKLFFGYCPDCNQRLFRWDWRKWVCLKCNKDYR